MSLALEPLINKVKTGKPDSAAANSLQEALREQFGEMCNIMQYRLQNFNVQQDVSPNRDLNKVITSNSEPRENAG